ncbi:nucleotidyltransferase family protein [Pediococcus acidilactici]|uniref:tRNA(Met) cytidine acetate ligase n=1 Tax=Pediococcus acidilactici TaxID=1254 RepID=UPI001329B377|nr:nucleotidyltransferase family protein [Pediococcus acidilactici]KAF0361505.1 hypothetical protein GBO49_01180 [Pediococcus acidilactici]KAF0375941.1 hypothetical protein GBO57_02755 [Pediococcus acidilactici]KAF0381616.1 hypothetical protein GBO61_00910 [Pediococcus acidilactici]KAF0407395.1 hypothetical protein GBO76_02705 [Pediococcus acidilactici]KAF0418668.1 hypothetical protein GBO81_02705 [Pediococcus acidilactici]
MQACAVIAEFNPFHNGHQYLLKTARKTSQADVMIVIMSGNFVQRGEPALINKWERAAVALQSGADLVVEMPTEYAVAAARDFAQAGVQIAQWLRADALAFGCETPGLDFQAQSRLLDRTFSEQDYNQSFASQLFAESSLSRSNDILGVNYAYWQLRLAPKLTLLPVERLQAGHLDQEIKGTIASATAIRQSIQRNDAQYQQAVPDRMKKVLEWQKPVDWQAFWPFLEYRLKTTSAKELRQIRGINEGIENRILAQAAQSSSFMELMTNLKTKRYSYTSLQRKLTAILLNLRALSPLQKTRLLAVNAQGQAYLREHDFREVLMTKVTKADFTASYQLTKRADELYQMVAPYEWGRTPILEKNVKEKTLTKKS